MSRAHARDDPSPSNHRARGRSSRRVARSGRVPRESRSESACAARVSEHRYGPVPRSAGSPERPDGVTLRHRASARRQSVVEGRATATALRPTALFGLEGPPPAGRGVTSAGHRNSRRYERSRSARSIPAAATERGPPATRLHRGGSRVACPAIRRRHHIAARADRCGRARDGGVAVPGGAGIERGPTEGPVGLQPLGSRARQERHASRSRGCVGASASSPDFSVGDRAERS